MVCTPRYQKLNRSPETIEVSYLANINATGECFGGALQSGVLIKYRLLASKT
jgi:hypothetical protein